jgi:signal transduction histidine kinase
MDAEFRSLLSHLNDLLSRLNASFEEMNKYAAKVSHELRTPLAIMRLKVEQGAGRIDEDLAEELESELHRLTHVVEQSLLIAKAEQGRLVVQRKESNLSSMVTDLVEDFQLLAQEDGRHLSLHAKPGVQVTSDERHLRQILQNLLTNALKHGHGDLRVRVTETSRGAALTIINRVSPRPEPEETLGLGLRVVEALLRLDSSIKFKQRRFGRYHFVRLSFAHRAGQPDIVTSQARPGAL